MHEGVRVGVFPKCVRSCEEGGAGGNRGACSPLCDVCAREGVCVQSVKVGRVCVCVGGGVSRGLIPLALCTPPRKGRTTSAWPGGPNTAANTTRPFHTRGLPPAGEKRASGAAPAPAPAPPSPSPSPRSRGRTGRGGGAADCAGRLPAPGCGSFCRGGAGGWSVRPVPAERLRERWRLRHVGTQRGACVCYRITYS